MDKSGGGSKTKTGGKKTVAPTEAPVLDSSPEDVHIEKLEQMPSAEEMLMDPPETSSAKTIIIMISVLVGVFALFLGGSYAYNYLTAGNVVDVDDLHKENLLGDLEEEEGYVYNGYSFVKADGLWWTEITRFGTLVKIPLHFGAKEVEHIPIVGDLDSEQFNTGNAVFIAINPNITNKYYSLALSELNFNVQKGIQRQIVAACTEDSYVCENRTIVSCEESGGKPVIQLAVENTTKVELKGTCIKISGNDYELVKAVDRVLYKWYGVME